MFNLFIGEKENGKSTLVSTAFDIKQTSGGFDLKFSVVNLDLEAFNVNGGKCYVNI